MTKPYSYQKWQTARVWPGGGWGEALAQVRKDQRLTQRDVAEYVGVSLATVPQVGRRSRTARQIVVAEAGRSRWDAGS